MVTLTTPQLLALGQFAGKELFASTVATFGVDDLQAAASAVDGGFDTTINAAQTAGHGTQTIIQALASVIPAPFSGATTQQKTLLACWVLMKRAGLI